MFGLGNVMKTVIQKNLTVTLAFALGAILIFAGLIALYALGAGGELVLSVKDWGAVGRSIIGTSLLAGLVVDAMRWAGAHLWPRDSQFRLRIGKVMRQNLA